MFCSVVLETFGMHLLYLTFDKGPAKCTSNVMEWNDTISCFSHLFCSPECLWLSHTTGTLLSPPCWQVPASDCSFHSGVTLSGHSAAPQDVRTYSTE